VLSVAYTAGGVRAGTLDGAPEFIIADAIEQYADFDPQHPMFGQIRKAPSNFKPSMLVDLESGRPIEVEVILGNVLRIAAGSPEHISTTETESHSGPVSCRDNAGSLSTPRYVVHLSILGFWLVPYHCGSRLSSTLQFISGARVVKTPHHHAWTCEDAGC
jgi:hypothetical protein